MAALIVINAWHWLGFIAFVLLFLALDLGIFHKRPKAVGFREALMWTLICFGLAMVFAYGLKSWRSVKESEEFLTGYLIELSLSMDNVFVIALIFQYFRIPEGLQHRVLFWGIVGALGMRGVMIGAGAALVSMLHWVLYLFGAFIVFTGVKMIFIKTKVDPSKSGIMRLARKFYPIAPALDGQKFLTLVDGKRALTPLALVLIMVETTDLIFAVDSIPAIFAITTNPFIVFTSNIFAILCLRSLYFVLAGAIGYFRYLKFGLSLVLVLIGVKMLLDPHDREPAYWFQVEIPISLSLLGVAVIILVSIGLSVFAAWRERARAANAGSKTAPRD